MKSTRGEISHILVKDEGIIACQAILPDGSSCTATLVAGRYEMEGYIDHEARRFLRLRDPNGRLMIVAELELLRQERRVVRRIHQRREQKAGTGLEHLKCVADAPAAKVSPIANADRSKVKARLREAIPESLPRTHLGQYEECGSVDSWTVKYSIERRDRQWIIHREDRGGERESQIFTDVAALVEDVLDRRSCPEYLVRDLRLTRRPHLITLANEVEEIAAARGRIGRGPVRPTPPGAAVPASPPPAYGAAGAAQTRRDATTHVDVGNTRIYRHLPEPVCAFRVLVNIGDRCRDLILATPNGCHEIDIAVQADRNGTMQPVLQLRGHATPDGRQQLVVTNMEAGKSEVIHV